MRYTKYFGIISLLVLLVGISICYYLEPGFESIRSYEKIAISDFGIIPKTRDIFNLTLVIAGVVGIIYSYFLKSRYSYKLDNLAMGIGFLSLSFLGLTPYDRSYVGHWGAAVLLFVMLSFAAVLRTLKYKKKSNRKYFLSLICSWSVLLILFSFFSIHVYIGEFIFGILFAFWMLFDTLVQKK